MRDPNLALLEDAARKLAPFLEEIVFIGGTVLGSLITDKAAAPIRASADVDIVAAIVSYADYMAFSERLRIAHFTEDAGENPLICRWHNGSLTLDVLPLSEEVFGFTNIWYGPALRHPTALILSSGQSIRIISAPFFLGTKMEAFRGRGKRDFQASHDLEDFVAVIEGRETLFAEIAASPMNLRAYLAESAKSLLAESLFLDALPGFVLNAERVPLIRERLHAIASILEPGTIDASA
jgi:predicted nucleotidyltransferase